MKENTHTHTHTSYRKRGLIVSRTVGYGAACYKEAKSALRASADCHAAAAWHVSSLWTSTPHHRPLAGGKGHRIIRQDSVRPVAWYT